MGLCFIDLVVWVGLDEFVDDIVYYEFNCWLMLEFNDFCEDFFCEGVYDNYWLLCLVCVVDICDDILM